MKIQATLTTVLSRSMKKFPTRLKAALLLLCPATTSSIVKLPSCLYCLRLRRLQHNQVIEMHPNYIMKHKCFSRACWSKWHLLSFLICTKPIPSAGNWKFKLRPGYDMSRRLSTSQVLLPRWEYLTLSIHPRWSGPASHSSKRKPIPSAIAWQFHSKLDVLLDQAVLHHTLSIFILVVVFRQDGIRIFQLHPGECPTNARCPLPMPWEFGQFLNHQAPWNQVCSRGTERKSQPKLSQANLRLLGVLFLWTKASILGLYSVCLLANTSKRNQIQFCSL